MKFKINGKKSYIGIIGFAVIAILEQQGVIDITTSETLKTAFTALFGVGIAHKMEKLEKTN